VRPIDGKSNVPATRRAWLAQFNDRTFIGKLDIASAGIVSASAAICAPTLVLQSDANRHTLTANNRLGEHNLAVNMHPKYIAAFEVFGFDHHDLTTWASFKTFKSTP
jgi:hypothetical protein